MIEIDPKFDVNYQGYGAVYCLHNIRNDKRYIGIAKLGRVRIRLKEHQIRKERFKENPHLQSALRIEPENFRHTILDYANDEIELFGKEKQYIAEYKTAQDAFGYNMTIGGDGRSPYFRPFEEAREYMRALKFKSSSDFYLWAAGDQRPKDIPSNPQVTYKGLGWKSWKDYFGVGRKPRTEPWIPFNLARRMVVILGLTFDTYAAWVKKSGEALKLPLHPERVYKDKGWTNWTHYLGTNRSELMYARHRIPGYTKWAARGLMRLNSINKPWITPTFEVIFTNPQVL